MCRAGPAKVLLHASPLDGSEAVAVVAIQAQRCLQAGIEIFAIVTLDGEAQTAISMLVARGYGISQTTGGMNNRYCTVAHGIQLTQAAGLRAGGHQIDVTTGINACRQPQIKGDLCRNPVRELLLKLSEEAFKMRLAGAKNQELDFFLPKQAAGNIAQQIHSLMTISLFLLVLSGG